MDIDISTKRLVSDLTLAEKQMVLIAKAVSIKCSILILDEPTAPLSHAETSKLFSMIHQLKRTAQASFLSRIACRRFSTSVMN